MTVKTEPSETPTLSDSPSGFGRNLGLGFCLLLITLLAYLPALEGEFIWDDDSYVEHNHVLRTPEGLVSIWTQPTSIPQYYPLVHTTFWIEYQLWGLEPLGYHVTNVVLHAIAAVLLWRILCFLRVPAGWFAAALFALHPVNVESVAWITERKNTLSAVFYFASALTYFRVVDDCDATCKLRRRVGYSLFCLFFVGALLSKSVTASLPAALLVVIWWKRGRISSRDWWRLIPPLLLALPVSLFTVWLEKHHVGASGTDWDFSGVERCLIAGRALWFYVEKLVFPHELAFNYPRWEIDTRAFWQYLYPLAAVSVLLVLWKFRHAWGRGPLAAALLFGGTLFPALGFFDVFPMKYSFVADHFQYLASIFPLTLIAVCIDRVLVKLKRESWFLGLASLTLVVLGFLTFNQCFIYENQETLWLDTIQKHPESVMAHSNLGVWYFERRNYDAAYSHYQRALELAPEQAIPHNNYGQLLVQFGRLTEAIAEFEIAVKLDPKYPVALGNLGAVLVEQGELERGMNLLNQAIELDPRAPLFHINLGRGYLKLGKQTEAEKCFQRADQLSVLDE